MAWGIQLSINGVTKYGSMETSDIKCLKELEAENRKLKLMFAELSLKSQLQERES
ncbi:hypothetical protein [Snodgrassella sp.]|uniref:hypothetical protein n=1 Tax=Snodgrassella sp. TaxID=2815304 RepID=UPI002584D445|nr:hypothetical protein [Snodgrassella sp.]